MKIEIVKNPKQGLEVAKHLVYKTVDSKTALFLSGGTTPKPLYKALSEEKKIKVGAVAMVDERYGLPLHKDSNEEMIKETGFVDYLFAENIPFYGILQQDRHSGKRSSALQNGPHPESLTVQRDSGVLTPFVPRTTLDVDMRRYLKGVRLTAEEHEKRVKNLFSSFPKRIAIMGIGEDGHIASLPTGAQSSKLKAQNYVTEINDFPGEFRQRITLTFKALSQMDLLVVLVFGRKKKEALVRMFAKGPVKEVPARFFKRPDIAKKTIVITDQKI